MSNQEVQQGTDRRSFLKNTGVIAAASTVVAGARPAVHAAEDNTIQVALIGCGGRGTGAAMQALLSKQKVKLVAMADAFRDRLDECYNTLTADDITDYSSTVKNLKDVVDVPEERKVTGERVNQIKTLLSDAVDARRGELESAAYAARLRSEPDVVTS